MEVIIKEKTGVRFEEIHHGEIFYYGQFHCIKIYDCDTDESVGLILDIDMSSYMETIQIGDDELIYRTFPNSKLIIE